MGRETGTTGLVKWVRSALRFIARASIIITVWSLAFITLARSAAQFVEHRRLAISVAALEQEHERQVRDYTAVLAEGERIVTSDEEQARLLKERLGYAKPDETPIIILRQQD